MPVSRRITNVSIQTDQEGRVAAMQVHLHKEVPDPDNPDAPFTKQEGVNCQLIHMTKKEKADIDAFAQRALEIADSTAAAEAAVVAATK